MFATRVHEKVREIHNESNIPIVDQLINRELNLREQLSKLHLDYKTAQTELLTLREEAHKLDVRERELMDLEQVVCEQELKLTTISNLHQETLELEKVNDMLHQSALSLRCELSDAKMQLDKVRAKYKERKKEVEISKKIEKDLLKQKDSLEKEDAELTKKEEKVGKSEDLVDKVKSKERKVERLKQLVNALSAEYHAKDAEIGKLEFDAIEHQRKIESTNARRAELEQRRMIAEEKKRQILATIADKDSRRKKVIEQREEIRRRREAVEREQDELDRLEINIRADEDRLVDQKRAVKFNETVEQARSERTTVKELRRKALEQDHMDNLDQLKSNIDEYLLKFEQDSATVELRFERLKRAADERRTALEFQQKKWSQIWKEKNQNADKIIFDLRSKVDKYENEVILEGQFEKLSSEKALIELRVKREREEIQYLTEGPGSERAILDRQEHEIRMEREAMAAREAELDQKGIKQQMEIEALETDVYRLQFEKDKMLGKKKAFELEIEADNRMLSVYSNQIPPLERRLKNLKDQMIELQTKYATVN